MPLDSPALPEDETFMRAALDVAAAAAAIGEVPVGAVVVHQGRILAQAHNLRETQLDPTAHAERLALTHASHVLGSWRLEACTLYSTLEPCPMCAGAVILARVPRLVYGANDPRMGAHRSLYRLLDDPRLNHRVIVTRGVLADACGQLLTRFFTARRQETSEDPRRGA